MTIDPLVRYVRDGLVLDLSGAAANLTAAIAALATRDRLAASLAVLTAWTPGRGLPASAGH